MPDLLVSRGWLLVTAICQPQTASPYLPSMIVYALGGT